LGIPAKINFFDTDGGNRTPRDPQQRLEQNEIKRHRADPILGRWERNGCGYNDDRGYKPRRFVASNSGERRR
jgi:hypothetical protein